MHSFEDKDIASGAESYLSRQLLEKHIKKFRVSQDFCVAEDAMLTPGALNPVKIRLDRNLFPDMDIITPGMFKHLEISMRSCFAQSGIHIDGKLFGYLAPDSIKELNQKGSTEFTVGVLNRGLSDVQLKAGGAFFRLYFRPQGQMITGKELYDIVQSGKLKVEGEYGKTWNLVGAQMPDPNHLDTAYEAIDLAPDQVDQGLTLKLKLNKNIYIPDNKNGIIIESKKNLVDVLQPFDPNDPRHADHDFNIGETYYVDFGDYFGAIVYQRYDAGGHHIISPLIDPGFKGPIRTEIVKGDAFNDFIELHIYHKDGR